MSWRGRMNRRQDSGGGFSPKSLPGLVLWLRADLGITLNGSNVSGWADQSGAGNSFTQSTGANQPGYSTTGNKAGTGPAVTFSGTQWLLATASILGGANVTAFATIRMTSTAVSQSFVGFDGISGTHGWCMAVDGPSTQRITFFPGVGTGFYNSFATTSWEAWTTAASAAHVYTLRVNGVDSGFTNTVTPSDGGAQAEIGALTNAGAQPLTGSIDEVIAYSPALSLIQVQQIEAYIRARTGIW